MKYYLDAAALTVLSDLRLEIVDSIKAKNLALATKNDLQLQFNNWFDSAVQSIYQNGSALPGDSCGSATNNNYPIAN
jgi:hypothetical protein